MDRVPLFAVALAVALSLAGCESPGPQVVKEPVHSGLTKGALLSLYGQPLRSEHHTDGSEAWYYHFGSQSRENGQVAETTVTDEKRHDMIGTTTSTTTTMTERPVRISSGGRVIGPVPSGSVITH